MIWLAMVSKDETEYHIKFDGHSSVESAKNEISEINKRLRLDGKIPLPYYIYEADTPMYGYEPYTLDDLDFNFYREPTEEEKKSRDVRLQELEKAFSTGNKDVIESTAKKILDEIKVDKSVDKV
jgi:hypothetical protein